MSTPQPTAPLDPLAVLKGLASLRRLTGTYPPGHPMIGQKLKELGDLVAAHLQETELLRIDVIRGDVFLDSVASSTEGQANQQLLGQLTALGVDSIHIRRGVELEEFLAVAEFLWQFTGSGDGVAPQLAARNVRHISLGKLIPLDTRWRMQKWPDAPTTPLDPDYAESILRAQQTFEDTAAGKPIDVVTVRDLVQVLIHKVARSNAALGQILAVKQYENLTYCHSVNVSVLSLLLGKQVGLDEPTQAALVEAALLHDVGKTQIPLEIVKKAGALDKSERKTIESHTTLGAEILVQTPGLHPLTPTVALEHHRGVKGTGYPELGTRDPAPDESDRVGRGHLRSHHRRSDLSGADAARARVPDPGQTRRRETEHGAGEDVRERDHVLPARLDGSDESKRAWAGHRDQSRRAAASRDHRARPDHLRADGPREHRGT